MSEILVIELLRRGFHEALQRVIAFLVLAFIAEEIFVTLFPFASLSVLAEVPCGHGSLSSSASPC